MKLALQSDTTTVTPLPPPWDYANGSPDDATHPERLYSPGKPCRLMPDCDYEFACLAVNAFGEQERLQAELVNTREEARADEREQIIILLTSGRFCRHTEHMQQICECDEIAEAIRKRSEK